MADEAAEETLDGARATAGGAGAGAGNEVDIRKTISSPALQQMLSLSNHRGGHSPSGASSSAGGFAAGTALLGGGGAGGGGAVAGPPATPASMPSG